MAGFVSHIRATQVRKRLSTELSGAARDFKNSCGPFPSASYRHAKPRAHSKTHRTNQNQRQKNWQKTRDAIQCHGQAAESTGMPNLLPHLACWLINVG